MKEKIKKLLESKNAKIERMEFILDMETAKEDELKEYDELEIEVKAINSKIEKYEALEKEKTQKAFEEYKSQKEKLKHKETETFTDNGPGETPVMLTEENKQKFLVGAFVKSKVAAREFNQTPAEFAQEKYGQRAPVTKALLSANSGTIPTPVFDEIFELMRNRMIFGQMGIQTVTLDHGVMDLSEQTGASGSNFVGENALVDVTDPTLLGKELKAKKIVTIGTVTKEILTYSSNSIDELLQNDLIKSTSELSDSALMRGTLSASNPNSVAGLTPAGNTQASAGSTIANIDTDLQFLFSVLEGNNSLLENPWFVMSPRTKNFIKFLRNANGELAFRGVDMGLLKDVPFISTAAIPINLTVSDSELYLLDAAQYLIGIARNMSFEVSDTASVQKAGSLVSAFHNDLRAYKMVHEVDIQAKQPDAAGAYISAVSY